MNLVKPTDFENRPYRIQNQEENDDFQNFIEEWEEKFLTDLLGYALYTEFAAAIDAETVLTKWTNLRDGAEYTYGGKTYKYKGLVNLLKPAIFSMWPDETSFKLAAVGYVQKDAPDKSKVISSEPFIVAAYNDYVTKVGVDKSYVNSLYGFMQVNVADYEDTWIFTQPELINRFGL